MARPASGTPRATVDRGRRRTRTTPDARGQTPGCVNQVVKTGGTTVIGANADATGIHLVGGSARVLNNDVIAVSHQGTGIGRGIHIEGGPNTFVVNNRIDRVDA